MVFTVLRSINHGQELQNWNRNLSWVLILTVRRGTVRGTPALSNTAQESNFVGLLDTFPQTLYAEFCFLMPNNWETPKECFNEQFDLYLELVIL